MLLKVKKFHISHDGVLKAEQTREQTIYDTDIENFMPVSIAQDWTLLARGRLLFKFLF